jgi:DNA-binding NtrC family response regulator
MRNLPTTSLPILLVDDEQQILFSYSLLLKASGIKNVHTLQDSRKVLPFLKKHKISVIVLDLLMPYLTGNELLREIIREYPYIPIIIMTGRNEVDQAVECMQDGAFDYLVKPVEKSRFISSAERALEICILRNEVTSLKKHIISDQLENEAAFSSIITGNLKMRAIFHYVEAIALTKQPVLVTGETGVGKELIARAVHNVSGCEGTFVAVNIAGLDDNIFSDTLFGHKKGAYTGAEQARDGLITQASGGTLFLDEIGDLSESSQVKLLRLLQEQKYYSLGSDIAKQSDARVIVATNKDLHKRMHEGKFRKDLYYRLRAHLIYVIPLRERLEDIPLLVGHFFKEAAESLNKKKSSFPPELITLLSTYNFPGNVRELQIMIFDAVAQHKSGILPMDSFKDIIKQEHTSFQTGSLSSTQNAYVLTDIPGRLPTLKEAEDYLISEALKLSDGNQGIAASILGITRQALNKRLTRKKS